MPYIVQGDSAEVRRDNYARLNFDYDYPYGLNLDPKSDFHESLRSKIWQRASNSRKEISKRFPSWNEIDQVLTTYIPLSDKEKRIKDKDSRKPVSIIFPYSYSNLESLLTYMSLAFFQDPIFQYEGVEDSDTLGAMLMELVIRLHCIKTKVPLALHTIFRDAFSYGVGIGMPGWVRRYGKIPVRSKIVTESELGTSEQEDVHFVDGLVFEGNDLSNIDPYLWLPDPSVSSDRIQDGEFIGWIDRDNYMNLLSEESNSGGDVFNVKYLRGKTDKRSSLATDESLREIRHGGTSKSMRQGMTSTTNPVDVINLYVTLIPKEWKLGDGEYPEKWFFRLAADDVIITCQKANYYHGMYPVAVASPEYDGYSITPIGRLEVLYGLQGVLDWLFNCYDDKTEVLTSVGWLKIRDAKKINADVATVDTDTGAMWFEKPKQWFEYDYDGYLKLFESKKYSLAVTPNHNMFGRYRYETEKQFKEAALINERSEWDEFKIPTAACFSGPQQDIVIDAVRRKGSTGRLPKSDSKVISSYVMAGFLGWLLSDGSIGVGKSSGTYCVSIKQSKSQYFKEIDYFTGLMPYHVNKYEYEKQGSCQWTITDKGLYNWIKDNCYHGGTTGEYKEVPDIIRHADRMTLKRFFDSFTNGDGYTIPGHDNLIQIGTESKQLADDLQEIAIKLGYSCTIRDSATSAGKPFWYLKVNKDAPWATITSRNTVDIRYKGKVYCFENSTHLTVVRRNGKAVLCGQSHVANVRKAINDMLIVDPYLVNINDLKDPEPGKLIRLRRPAWGHGVDKVVQQLGVTDITRLNIADSAYITQWMDRISGADQSMAGIIRQTGPERLTRGEFQGTRSSAISRLQRIAMLIGYQFMQDIGTMFAVHTQQYMTKETFVKITGRYEDQLKSIFGPEATRAPVSPLDLAISYDLIVRDGSIPGGNFSEAWLQLFQTIGSTPELLAQFDITRIFMYIAQQLGAKNVEDFKRNVNRIQPTQMSDEQVVREAERGNIVPTEEI